jgi:ribosomal protein L6P/L9E
MQPHLNSFNQRGVIIMKATVAVLLVGATLAAAPVLAQQPGASTGIVAASRPGEGAIASVVTVSATVEAIDKEDRVVTLKGPQGNLFNVVAGPEVRNFDQIKTGDQVVVRHTEALTLELKKGGGGLRERVETDAAARAAPGAQPGAVVTRRVTVVADVVAVNARTQTVTLRGPKRTVELQVRNPDQFKLVKVGDQVEATYTDAVAIAVEKL